MDIGVLMDDNFVTNVHLVYQDNQSTIALVKTSSKANSRSKYMKVRQEYVRERLGTSELEIEFLSWKLEYSWTLVQFFFLISAL